MSALMLNATVRAKLLSPFIGTIRSVAWKSPFGEHDTVYSVEAPAEWFARNGENGPFVNVKGADLEVLDDDDVEAFLKSPLPEKYYLTVDGSIAQIAMDPSEDTARRVGAAARLGADDVDAGFKALEELVAIAKQHLEPDEAMGAA